ncbi:hypothetical protein [Pseudomonas putida]
MDSCALEFIARRWWRRAEVWIMSALLVAGGADLGWQSDYWAMASTQASKVAEIREAYDAAMTERHKRLDELTRTAVSAAIKASKAAMTATQDA